MDKKLSSKTKSAGNQKHPLTKFMATGDISIAKTQIFRFAQTLIFCAAALAFGYAPFGAALILSGSYFKKDNKKRSVLNYNVFFPTAAAAMISVLFSASPALYLIVYCSSFAVAAVYRAKNQTAVFVRAVASAVAAAVLSIPSKPFSDNFMLLSAVMGIVLSAVVCVIFNHVSEYILANVKRGLMRSGRVSFDNSGLSGSKKTEPAELSENGVPDFITGNRNIKEIGGYILCNAFVLIRFFSWFNISLLQIPVIICFLATLLVAGKITYLFGGLCGLVCGIAAGQARFIPAAIIMGLLFGAFPKTRHYIALPAIFTFSMLSNAYLLSDEFIAPLFINASIALAIFILIHRKIPAVKITENDKSTSKGKFIPAFSACFASLSQIFYTVSEQTKKSGLENAASRIHAAVGSVCDDCRGCKADKYDLANNIITQYKTKGSVNTDQIPPHVANSCKRLLELTDTVNYAVTSGKIEAAESVSMLADGYGSFSKLLNMAADADAGESRADRELSRRIKELLFARGVISDRVITVGSRRKTIEIFGVAVNKLECSSKQLTAELSSLCGVRLSSPTFSVTDGEPQYTTMRFETVPVVNVECSYASGAKTGEDISGDTVSFFEHDDYFYALISDGMGSGRDAALCSKLASVYLEKLLCIGADRAEAINMLNKLLIAKNDEIFTTVDLLVIDKLNGEAAMIKAGAAPSYLLRTGKATKIESKTLPAGIIGKLNAEEIKFKLRRGDCMLLVSDGVELEGENDEEAFDFSKYEPVKSASRLISSLMIEAAVSSGARDDLSAIAVKII